MVKRFKHFVIVENHFPYDAVASESLIIFPKRHVTESELSREEQEEFMRLKTENKFVRSFDYILTGMAKTSIPAHFHAHLVKLKHR